MSRVLTAVGMLLVLCLWAVCILAVGATEAAPSVDRRAPEYRAEFAPVDREGGPRHFVNPALIERMEPIDEGHTRIQLASGNQYAVACGLEMPASNPDSCAALFRVGIWVQE